MKTIVDEILVRIILVAMGIFFTFALAFCPRIAMRSMKETLNKEPWL